MDLKKHIRSIPDYPKKGILFRDITTLIKNANAFRYTNDKIIELTNAEKISRKKPFCEDFYENDEIIIEDGPLKGQITKILSLQAEDRVKVLINILGSLKEIQISKNIIKKI